MTWAGNWDSNWPTARQNAASRFLKTGTLEGFRDLNKCTSSFQCASGFACVDGKCVKMVANNGGDSGTTSGCGDPSTGGVRCVSSSGSGRNCVSSGCSSKECNECNGPRTCRYDAFGTVNCFCGEPEQQGCSDFCTAYKASNGEDADGCSGLACDECSFCDENFVSATGTCSKKTDCSSPCHCGNSECLGPCEYCTEDGGTKLDEKNCLQCYTSFRDCGCTEVKKVCCYTFEEIKSGLSGFNRCYNSIDCSKVCGAENPCMSSNGSGTSCSSSATPCPAELSDPHPAKPSAPSGEAYEYTGCISTGGQVCWLYNILEDISAEQKPSICDQCGSNKDCPPGQCCTQVMGKKSCGPCTTATYTIAYSGAYGGIFDSCGASKTNISGSVDVAVDASDDQFWIDYKPLQQYGDCTGARDTRRDAAGVMLGSTLAMTVPPASSLTYFVDYGLTVSVRYT